MFVVVYVACGLLGEREKKLWKRAQRSHERAVKVSRCFRPDLLVALQLICALNKQNRQLGRPSPCTDPPSPPTPSPQENRLRGPGT